MSDKEDALIQTAQDALNDEDALKAIVADLSGSSRLSRQHAASVLVQVAKLDISAVAPFNKDLIDALNRPEARTRWECLDILTSLVTYDSKLCDKAIAGAESSLFDEDNGQVRLSAMRFLCKYGATTKTRSEKTWPLIDEGIQCYHGDVEFNDMLNALVEFSTGKLSDSVKTALVDRVSFDAENSKGALKNRSAQIIANIKK